jgi:hypothetical protein
VIDPFRGADEPELVQPVGENLRAHAVDSRAL